MAADWFFEAIRKGLQRLLVLRLDGSPAKDTVRALLHVWVDALWPGTLWHQERDEARIAEAFRRMSSKLDRWPAPIELRRFLPPPEWGQRYQALPPVEHSPETRKLARREIAKIRKRLRLGEGGEQ